jgi:hypothetical protein
MIGQNICSLYVYKARNTICNYIEIRAVIMSHKMARCACWLLAVINLCSLSLPRFPHPEAYTTVIPTVAPYPENGTNMTNEQEVHSR